MIPEGEIENASYFSYPLHLGERDCSTQRRYQKLIDKAGAPDITDELRQEIHDAAVKPVKNISYENADTLEFVFDQDAQKFYFLEMNTRLPFFYDSLIAKVIVPGDDREHTRRRMICALDEFCVEGISTTVQFLKKVLETPGFAEGRVNT